MKYFVRLWMRYVKDGQIKAIRKGKIVSKVTAAGQLPLRCIFYITIFYLQFSIEGKAIQIHPVKLESYLF